ncbi:unnamed protein product [Coregonus sp. 'balchen']|nr:unnamed protein product [Coregonus sp. 'balchen']
MNINAASEDLINGLEEYIAEGFATVTVREGVDIIQTNISFLRQQFTRMATPYAAQTVCCCTQGLALNTLRCTDRLLLHPGSGSHTLRCTDRLLLHPGSGSQHPTLHRPSAAATQGLALNTLRCTDRLLLHPGSGSQHPTLHRPSAAAPRVWLSTPYAAQTVCCCTQGLALNLYCLRGEQRALTTRLAPGTESSHHTFGPRLLLHPGSGSQPVLSPRGTESSHPSHQPPHHEDVSRGQPQPGQLADQYDDHETPCHSGAVTEAQAGQQTDTQNMEMDEGLSPAPATTAGEAMVSSGDRQEVGASPRVATPSQRASSGETGRAAAMAAGRREESVGDVEPWAATVPLIRHDMKTQPPLSDAYLHWMPAKRRKTHQGEGPQMSLSEAVSRAARAAGVIPVSSPDSLQGELEEPELQEAYQEQVRSDIKERVRDDQDFSSQHFPNTHRAFSLDDS